MIKCNLKNFIANIFLSVCILLILELMVRIFYPQIQTEPLFLPDEETITCLKKNATVRSSGPEYKVTYILNSRGLRGPEYSYQKNKGVIRILGLGDSFTFGIGVDEKDTYLKKLEGLLTAEFQKEYKIEVINAGIGGWGTAQELIYLKKEGLRYNPDLITIGFFVNDPSDNDEGKLYKLENNHLIRQAVKPSRSLSAVKKVTTYIPFYNFLTRHSQFLSLLRSQLTIILTSRNKKNGPNYKNLDLTKALLKKINQLARANGSELIIILIPSKEQFLTQGSPSRNMQLEVIRFCRDNNIKVLDLFSDFNASQAQSLYFTNPPPECTHWNRSGHNLCAHILYDYLKDYNLYFGNAQHYPE